jgi:Ca-activated chloride channel homolog
MFVHRSWFPHLYIPKFSHLPFYFQHKEFIWLLLGLPILLLLFIALLRWKKKTRQKIGDKKLVKILIANHSAKLFATRFILLSVAFAIGVVAVMNPRKPGSSDTANRKGIDLAIVLDVSKSMLATDLAPNRLERAKQFINKLINSMPNDRIGLVLFAGKAYLQMPLTTDHGAAQLFVSSATPDAISQQGTVISDALKMGALVFNTAEKRFKTVVLISDGEDHDENAIATAKDLADQGVMINTVGIGSPEGSVLADPVTGQNKIDATGSTVISKLNEEELKEIASNTNGVYIRLQNGDEAVHLLQQQLSQIDRKAFQDESTIDFKTYYMWLAGAMLLLLIIEIFIPERKKQLA